MTIQERLAKAAKMQLDLIRVMNRIAAQIELVNQTIEGNQADLEDIYCDINAPDIPMSELKDDYTILNIKDHTNN